MSAILLVNEGQAKFGGEVKPIGVLGEFSVPVAVPLPGPVVDDAALREIHAGQIADGVEMPMVSGAKLPGTVGVKAKGGLVTIRVFAPNVMFGATDAFIILDDGQEFYTKTKGEDAPAIEIVAA